MMKELPRTAFDARRVLAPLSSCARACAALVLLVGGSGCAGDDGAATSATASEATGTASDTSTGTTADETTGASATENTSTSAGSDSTSTGESTESTDATDATDATGETTGDTDDAIYLVWGAIYRSADLEFAPGNDGVGPVTVGIVDDCTYPPNPFVFTTIPDADLSDPNARVEYLLTASPGTYYLLATLDDNENEVIDSGDLIPAEGLTLKCVEFVITDADLEGVDLELDFVLP